jgi:hypothetical protein
LKISPAKQVPSHPPPVHFYFLRGMIRLLRFRFSGIGKKINRVEKFLPDECPTFAGVVVGWHCGWIYSIPIFIGAVFPLYGTKQISCKLLHSYKLSRVSPTLKARL